MPDQLTDRARKAAEEVLENMSQRPTYTWVDDTTEIFERYMRETMTAAQEEKNGGRAMLKEIRGCGKCSNNDGIQNDVWGCSVFCRVRGKTKKRYEDCNHFSENKPEITEDAIERTLELDNDALTASYMLGVENGKKSVLEDPMVSVIRWTRYDGTPETLPESGREILCYDRNARYLGNNIRGEEMFLRMDIDRAFWAYLPEPPEDLK